MFSKFVREIPALILVTLPAIYLAYIWGDLPERIPLHWNLQGEVNRYGSKSELLLLVFLLPVLVYVIFLIVPAIDPKKQIQQMGGKYQNLKLLLVGFCSLLCLFIMYTTATGSFANPNFIMVAIGILFMVLANYFQTIRPNYFIGIRTPWTLENETVWKDTHRLGGRIWFGGGLLIAVLCLVLSGKVLVVAFMSIVAVMAFFPIVYSYLRFRSLDRANT